MVSSELERPLTAPVDSGAGEMALERPRTPDWTDWLAESGLQLPQSAPVGSSPQIHLDGMNIVFHTNNPPPAFGRRDCDWNWENLHNAARFFKRRHFTIAIFLPEYAINKIIRRGRGEATITRGQELANAFGTDVIVRCKGKDPEADDNFILQTAKLGDTADSRTRYIVTNDQYRNQKNKGLVEQSWIDSHVIGFCFAFGEFVPNPEDCRRLSLPI